ncbi:phage major capsid protein [Rhizobium sp. SSA_523]|uniref:phage major capsid protein n=1 Tax=Rhizobium sp. SSA_523 TaxID=2952477 RepID=UPI00209047E4|nr:phage major capsid protein [Rhizobium sp. SSA_523]MCO5730909.1 phage major capsid protein [Rhizobium sp. SSA_523]WKC24278.1 phage major capsid protein [Rhizobium sp. SSA_523]
MTTHAQQPALAAHEGRPPARRVAPEAKAVPDVLDAAFHDLMEAFETFKETNDRRLGEIEHKLTADVVTRDKVERINSAIDEQKAVLDQLVLKRQRPALSGRGEADAKSLEHKAAFEAYLRRGEEAGLRDLEAKAMSAGSATDGGYLVPPETDSEIGRRLSMVSPMRALSSIRTVSSGTLKKPFSTAGLATGWVSETAQRPQTASPVLTELTFPTMELYAMPAATQALLDDAAVDIEDWLAGEVDIVFAEQEGDAFIRGDGINKPKGFLAYPSIADGNWSWGNLGHIATGAAGAFATTSPSDVLINALYALKSGHRQAASFMMNRKTQSEIRKFKDADGNYLWRPPQSAGEPATLMGYRLAEAEEMPDIAANANAIAVGDFRSGYLVVDRLGLRILRDPYSAKPYVLFYTTKRVGGGVQNFEAIKLVKFAAN